MLPSECLDFVKKRWCSSARAKCWSCHGSQLGIWAHPGSGEAAILISMAWPVKKQETYIILEGCFNTPLEHTPKPLPTGFKGDCVGWAPGVCCNFLGYTVYKSQFHNTVVRNSKSWSLSYFASLSPGFSLCLPHPNFTELPWPHWMECKVQRRNWGHE